MAEPIMAEPISYHSVSFWASNGTPLMNRTRNLGRPFSAGLFSSVKRAHAAYLLHIGHVYDIHRMYIGCTFGCILDVY